VSGCDEFVELKAFHRAQHGLDATVESGTVGHNLEDVFDCDEFFSLENASDGVDLLAGQFGEVGEVYMKELYVL
jgi:hypothetical protein